MPLTVCPREGLPVIGSVSDSMACSIPSETSKLFVLEDLGYVCLSCFWNEKHSNIDHIVLEPGHILSEQCQVDSTSGAAHRSSQKLALCSSEALQCKEGIPLQVEVDRLRLWMNRRTFN